MSLRFWVGFWLAVILLLMVAFDLSFLVRYITRFTEESFAVLISLIFIYEAFSKVAEIYHNYPVGVGYEPGRHNVQPCLCVKPTLDQMTLNETAHNMTALLASGNLPFNREVDHFDSGDRALTVSAIYLKIFVTAFFHYVLHP